MNEVVVNQEALGKLRAEVERYHATRPMLLVGFVILLIGLVWGRPHYSFVVFMLLTAAMIEENQRLRKTFVDLLPPPHA